MAARRLRWRLPLLLLLLTLPPSASAAPTPPGEECCWCGKPYIRDRPSQTTALAANAIESSREGSARGPPDPVMAIRGMLGPADVRPDKGFYVEGLDSTASLVVVVLHPPADRQLVMTLALNGDKLPEEDEKFQGEHFEKIRWEVQLPYDGQDSHWLELPLKLRAGLRTKVHWTLADWPLLRHTGGGKILSKGTVPIVVAESLAVAQGVGAVRVVHLPNRTAHLEAFEPQSDTPKPFFPYGFFANWGGWMGKDLETGMAIAGDSTVGNMVHPVSPFDPGGLDAVERFLGWATEAGVRWEHDMRHLTADPTAIISQIERFKTSPAVLSWYISDEPDGAGEHAGPPVGLSPATVRDAYEAAKQADPYHPVSLSLNCMESARYYAGGADIVMVDPYPVGINPDGCDQSYGCCGCDDCDTASVSDVGTRVRHVGQELLGGARPIGLVAQAFGGEHHWDRGPTVQELRAMTYLGVLEGAAGGVTYWLREENTDAALLDAARAIAGELKVLAPTVLAGRPLPREVVGVFAKAAQTKKGGAGRVAEEDTAGLNIAGWCEENLTGGNLKLSFLLVNAGTGRRGGVRLSAPRAGRWLAVGVTYGKGFSPPDKPSVALVEQPGVGVIGVLDKAPLAKFAVRLYTLSLEDLLAAEGGGGCEGLLAKAAEEKVEAAEAAQQLKSEL